MKANKPLVIIKMGTPAAFTDTEKQTFLDMLIEQGKTKEPNMDKIKNCKLLGFAMHGNTVVSIAAVKTTTTKRFGAEFANVPNEAECFKTEIGYAYTPTEHRGNGYSTKLMSKLIEKSGQNMLATTGWETNNPMINILLRLGFVRAGKTWKSRVDGNTQIALFLKYHS